MDEPFKYGIEITLSKPDDFNIIKESLTRIGIKSKKNNTIYQSCHILHKRGRYYILHFLELFAVDGKENNMSDEDYSRRDAIVRLLNEWKICRVLNSGAISDSIPYTKIDVIPFKDKKDYVLVSKYSVGSRKQSKEIKNE